MTMPNDQFVDIAKRSQEAVTTAVRTWAETMRGFASTAGSGQSPLPDLGSVVEQYFDFAEKALANQRELAQQWVSATAKAAEQTQRTTLSVVGDSTNGTEAVVNTAAETAARVTAENAAASARATDDAVTT